MSKRLDNLFRKKLDDFRSEPSAEAWSKIESAIHPDKSSWKFYMGIAASIALIAVITYFVFLPGKSPENLVAQEQPVENSEVPSNDNVVEMNEPEHENEAVVERAAEERPAGRHNKESRPTSTVKVYQEPLDRNVATAEEVADTKDENEVRIASPTLGEANSLTAIAAEFTDNPIAFSAQKVELPKSEVEQPKKGINLKKVIDLARELKTDNESWGSLREAKDELLSLGKKKLESSED